MCVCKVVRVCGCFLKEAERESSDSLVTQLSFDTVRKSSDDRVLTQVLSLDSVIKRNVMLEFTHSLYNLHLISFTDSKLPLSSRRLFHISKACQFTERILVVEHTSSPLLRPIRTWFIDEHVIRFTLVFCIIHLSVVMCVKAVCETTFC